MKKKVEKVETEDLSVPSTAKKNGFSSVGDTDEVQSRKTGFEKVQEGAVRYDRTKYAP